MQQKLSKTGADRLERDMLHIRIAIIRKRAMQITRIITYCFLHGKLGIKSNKYI